MSLTLPEIKNRLNQLDEITLLEILSINSEDIIERFSDWIENLSEDVIDDLEAMGSEESDGET